MKPEDQARYDELTKEFEQTRREWHAGEIPDGAASERMEKISDELTALVRKLNRPELSASGRYYVETDEDVPEEYDGDRR